MPEICRFKGIRIFMNTNDHNPPHIHAKYGEYECSIDINEIELLVGNMPNRQLKMIYGWMAEYQQDLLDEWYLAEQGEPLFAIPPLERS
ncbi:MAG: DUF4160 domain-containing protein [Peptostreptococcaceae bacterium]